MEKLPFRIIVNKILPFFLFEKSKDRNITDFYGRFKKDKTKTIFQLFSCFEIDSQSLNEIEGSIPIQNISFIQFRFVWDANMQKIQRVLEQLKTPNSLKGIVKGVANGQLLSKFQELKELSLDYCIPDDQMIKDLNSRKKLKKLSFQINPKHQHQLTFSTDLQNNYIEYLYIGMSTASIHQFTFRELKSLHTIALSHYVISKTQLNNLLNLENLRKISFFCVTFDGDSYLKILETPQLKSVGLNYSRLLLDHLSKLNIPENSMIEELHCFELGKMNGICPAHFLSELCKLKHLNILNIGFIKGLKDSEVEILDREWEQEITVCVMGLKLSKEFKSKQHNKTVRFVPFPTRK